jgi:hypothetical protein
MSSKALKEFLREGDEAGALMAKAQQLLGLRLAIEPAIPQPLRNAWRVANLKDGKLIVYAAHNAAAARIALLAPTLIQACLGRGVAIKDLKVEVQPAAFAQRPRRSKRTYLSQGAKRSLKVLEGNLKQGELRERIRAMAARGENED